MKEVKISIIVPVYNVADRLETCLSSLISQTCEEIEILCAEDCSNDGSREILFDFAQKDSRVVPILHDRNMGTSQMRKDAVLASHGKYVMFVDGDDFLAENACERAYCAIENAGTDMLQYGVNVVNCAKVAEERIESNRRIVRPCTETIRHGDIINLVWKERKFHFQIWNKIFDGDICRRAFEQVEDGYFPKAQDLYAFFLISYYSESTAGISDELYNYNFGIGVTGSDCLSETRFETLLLEKKVYDAIGSFLEKEGKSEEYRDVVHEIYQGFLGECVNKWIKNLRTENLTAGFKSLTSVWGYENVLSMFAEKYWVDRIRVAEKLVNVDCFMYKKNVDKNVLTIAAYYRSIRDGGAQRVVAELCNLWQGTKDVEGNSVYRVVLITDERKEENEYELNENVTRCYLPAYDVYTKGNYEIRQKAWDKILTEQDVDVVVDSMWEAPCTFYDMLSVKGHKNRPAFLIHAHSFCGKLFKNEGRDAMMQAYMYQMCDGVITLSECDEAYVSTFCPHTRYIVNPPTFECNGVSYIKQHSVQDEIPEVARCKKLLWVGRLSQEKNPLDVVYAMNYITKQVPETVLYLVGGGSDEISNQLKAVIQECNLGKNIIMTGFQKDVEPYYREADIFLGTSEYEGYPLTISEALSCALPVVAYDIPWLSFMRDGRGIITVPQKRPDLLAEEVIKLIYDPDRCTFLGRCGREQIKDIRKRNIGEEWKEFFDTIGNETDVNCEGKDSTEKILYRYLTIFQQEGREKALSARDLSGKKLQEVQREKARVNGQLQRAYQEKTERGIKIKELEVEKSERGVKIKELEKEKAERGIKIKELEKEKAERGIKIKGLEKEKAERGVKIKDLEKEKADRGIKIKELEKEKAERGIKIKELEKEKADRGITIKKLQEEKMELESHFLVRLDRKLRRIFHR